MELKTPYRDIITRVSFEPRGLIGRLGVMLGILHADIHLVALHGQPPAPELTCLVSNSTSTTARFAPKYAAFIDGWMSHINIVGSRSCVSGLLRAQCGTPTGLDSGHVTRRFQRFRPRGKQPRRYTRQPATQVVDGLAPSVDLADDEDGSALTEHLGRFRGRTELTIPLHAAPPTTWARSV